MTQYDTSGSKPCDVSENFRLHHLSEDRRQGRANPVAVEHSTIREPSQGHQRIDLGGP